MKVGVTIIKDETAKLLAGLEALGSTRVMVGVPAAETPRRDGEAINNAALAYIHDNGAPEANIPARPFMEPGIGSVQVDIEAGLKKAGSDALDGRPEAVDRDLHAVGLKAQAAIRGKITAGPFAPLKPSTLAARRSRGRRGDKPLIDTGQLRNAINYVIRKV